MRDVEWGWLIRMHSTGASLFFIVVYLHMFRGLLYGSYQKPRELVWILGMLIYLVLMAEAFMGYAAMGPDVVLGRQGDHLAVRCHTGDRQRPDRVDHGPTRSTASSRCMSSPCRWCCCCWWYCTWARCTKWVQPDGDQEGPKGNRWSPERSDGIPFHPYYTLKDGVGAGFLLIIAAFIIFFAPGFGGLFLEHDNFTEANRWSPRSTSSRSGTTRRTTRCCAWCRTSSVACW